MSLLFLDTSALLKLYITEIGSNWIKNFVTGHQNGEIRKCPTLYPSIRFGAEQASRT